MEAPFVNKVAQSGIITLDLAEYYPKDGDLVSFDLKPFLFMEMILKEKDYREALKNHDWESHRDKIVCVHCSADAIIPVWAYMLAASYLAPVARTVVRGNPEEVREKLFARNIEKLDIEAFRDQRVVLKGCGEIPVSESAYLEVTAALHPVVKSIMYGEPCSTVPIYKRRD